MNKPLVSVVIETITARFDCTSGSLANDLAVTLEALNQQTYPNELIEPIVVIDDEVSADDASALRARFPTVKFVTCRAPNYFAAKNAGAAVAAGDFIALLDGDCEPAPIWLETLLARFEPGIAAVAGRTRYKGESWAAWTFSIPDFANVLAKENDAASGFNINNVAFTREVFSGYKFDTRIPRNGGCYLLFHQLRADGARILYEPRAVVAHGLDIQGLGFVRKHFDRGYDGVTVYRIDERCVLRSTRFFRRFGAAGLMVLTCRRIVTDWLRLLRFHKQMGISVVVLPYFGAVTVATRLIELAGGVKAMFQTTASGQEN